MTVAVFDRDEGRATEVSASIGEAAISCAGDVSDPEAVEAALDRLVGRGQLRLAVSCAGIGIVERTVAPKGAPHALESFQRVHDVNVTGTFNVARLAAARMASNPPDADGGRGLIVNTASIAAFDGQTGQVAYGSSKAAVVGLTLPMARDLAPLGVRVVTIAPGSFDTPMNNLPPEILSRLPEPTRERWQAGHDRISAAIQFPRRDGRPEEYARFVLQLLDSPYLNGEVVRLDAGLRLPAK